MPKSNAWIKFEKSLIHDPRVGLIAEKLVRNAPALRGVTPVTVVTLVLGGLMRMWCYSDTYIRNADDVIETTPDLVNQFVGIENFVQLLPQDWFEVVDATHVKFPEFHRHNASRSKNAARQARFRERAKSKKDTSDVTDSVTPALRNAVTGVTHNALDRDRDQDLLESSSSLTSVPMETHHFVPTSVARPPASVEKAASVRRVFEYWKNSYQHPRAQLDPKRRKLIETALLSYDETTLIEAIEGYKNSSHHAGLNERATVYDDIGLFLRDAAHIDAGLTAARRGAVKPLSAVEQMRQNLMTKINGTNGNGSGCSEDSGHSDLVEAGGLFR